MAYFRDAFQRFVGPLADDHSDCGCDACVAARDFDPSEPRVPSGETGGGEWTAGAGGAATKRERTRAFLIPTLTHSSGAYRGKQGELTHGEVFRSLPDDIKEKLRKDGADQKYTTPEGDILGRREARKYAEKHGLLNKWGRDYQQPDLIAEHLKPEAAAPIGHGIEFYTPNTRTGMDLKRARERFDSEAQGLMRKASKEIDDGLGIKAEAKDAIGAWESGAENSFVTQTHNATMDQLRVSAAMKGSLGNQIATLIFRESRVGTSWLYSFDAPGELADVHQKLLDHGIAYHTIVPGAVGSRSTVYVVDTDDSLSEKVEAAAKEWGSEVEARYGDAEFLGTKKGEDVNDSDRRADAQAEYARIIAGSRVQGAGAVWDRVHSAYSPELERIDPSRISPYEQTKTYYYDDPDLDPDYDPVTGRKVGSGQQPAGWTGQLDFDPSEPRAPKGVSTGGQWVGLKGSSGHASTISTRKITPVDKPKEGREDSEKSYARIDLASVAKDKDLLGKMAKQFEAAGVYPGLKKDELKGDAGARLDTVKRRMVDNLRFLFSTADTNDVKLWRGWYEGAHSLAAETAKTYGLGIGTASAVYAALSPQTVWDVNVAKAQRLVEIMKTHANERWDDKMTTAAKGWLEAQAKGAKSDDQKETQRAKAMMFDRLAAHGGVKLADLTNVIDKANWIHAYDEAHNDPRYHVVGIDGKLEPGFAQSVAKGGEKKDLDIQWGTDAQISGAIRALESDGDRTKISDAMGDKHKVRSFYNNILDPDSDNEDVTVDTHAVGAAWLRYLGGSSGPVSHALALGAKGLSNVGSNVLGVKGTYPVYADAYRDLAHELKMKPRELQSVLWEQKIKFFKNLPKGKRTEIEEVWQKFHDSPRMKLEDAQAQVLAILQRKDDGDGSDADDE